MTSEPERKIGECAYCGEIRPLSREHVPPKNLFSKPRPSDLITIPCCDTCNNAASKDDEYFRLAITTGINPSLFPNEFAVSIDAILKLGKPRKLGLAKTMLASFRKESIHTPGGTLDRIGVLNIDAKRIKNVISRIVQGLYFYHLGERLPDTHNVRIWSDWFGDLGDQALLTELESILDVLRSEVPRMVGGRVFRYLYHVFEDVPDVMVWWLSFYNHREFLCFTLPRNAE